MIPRVAHPVARIERWDCIAALVKLILDRTPVLDKKEYMNPDAKTAAPPPTQETQQIELPSLTVARREPVEHVLHGDRRVDHYAWLRPKKIPKSSPI